MAAPIVSVPRRRPWVPAFAGMTRDGREWFVFPAEAGIQGRYLATGAQNSVENRSSHWGFPASINLSFHPRRHSFSCFSSTIAWSIASQASNHTRIVQP